MESYESIINKHGNTIEVDTLLDEAARTLITPRETLEVKLALVGLLAIIDTLPDLLQNDTSPPSPSIIDSTDKSTTEPDQIERIPTAKEPQIESSSISHIKVNTIGQNNQNIKPSRAFAHPNYKIKLVVAKGASSKNIIKGKRIRKPAAFYFKRIY